MATLYLTGATKVAELKKQFNEAFGSQIKVYAGNKVADVNETLSSIGLTKDGKLECPDSMSVADFVQKVKSEFGLKVKVYTCDEWVAVLDALSLANSGRIKKNATKADMEKLLTNEPVSVPVETTKKEAKSKDATSKPMATKVETNTQEKTATAKTDKESEMEEEIKRLKAELAKAKEDTKPKAEKTAKKSNDPFENLMITIEPGERVVKSFCSQRVKTYPNGRNHKAVEIDKYFLIEDKYIANKSFAICKYPVTQKQWVEIMGEIPTQVQIGDDLPVTNITLVDIDIFLKKLNLKTGKQYRLPTGREGLWAKIQGAGELSNIIIEKEIYPCEESRHLFEDYMWICDGKPHPIGLKKPLFNGVCDLWNVREYRSIADHVVKTDSVNGNRTYIVDAINPPTYPRDVEIVGKNFAFHGDAVSLQDINKWDGEKWKKIGYVSNYFSLWSYGGRYCDDTNLSKMKGDTWGFRIALSK